MNLKSRFFPLLCICLFLVSTITSIGTVNADDTALTISATTGGTTNPMPGTGIYTLNSSIVITAIPQAGFYFDHWNVNGQQVDLTKNPGTFTIGENDNIEAVFAVNPPYMASFQWTYEFDFPVCSSPVIADLYGDESIEVVLGTQDGIYCFTNTGTFLWKYLTGSDDNFPTAADLDSNGKKEVLVSSDNGVLSCLDGDNGDLVWASSWHGNSLSYWNQPPTVGDLNNDGKLEIVVVSGGAACFDDNGNKMWELPNWNFFSAPTIADINGDGKLEIIFSVDSHFIVCFDSSGNMLWDYRPTPNYTWGYGNAQAPAVADINGDGAQEIVVYLLGIEEIDEVYSPINKLYILDRFGGLLSSSVPINGDFVGQGSSSPSVGDINGDNNLEIVLGMTDGIYAFNSSANILWIYSTGSPVYSTPAITNVNGQVEIIVGPDNGVVTCLNGAGNQLLWRCDVTDDPITQTCSGQQSSPVVYDIDNNGELEVLIASRYAIYSLFPTAFTITSNIEEGNDVTVHFDETAISMTFSEINEAGMTSVVTSIINPGETGEDANYQLLNIYYEITCDATYTGPVTICFAYDPSITGEVEDQLKILHWNGADWEDITISVDKENNLIYAQTLSFSCFALANKPYVFSGLLEPFNADKISIFKLRSTLPLRFQLRDELDNIVSDATAELYLTKISNSILGTEIEAVSTCAADSGNLFRYDEISSNYMFNLATKTLTAGTWQIRIALDDGTSKYTLISLK